ncbi:MAG: hypothetical protein HOH43_21070 [Candidatus Latescibacteria bacterium]|jgi:hypothetical protein|nr:hypothetical protein [Candidatus Latescibacterota bacterium]
MLVSKNDREVLRALASQIAEIATLPDQKETTSLWKALNGLKPKRPMVMIDQIPWHEMNVDDELTVLAENDFCRALETRLRRTLYCWHHMRADMVVEPEIEISKVIHGMDFGLQRVEKRAETDPSNDVVSHYYIDQLATEEDLDKIKIPEVVLDCEATDRAEAMAHEVFDGVLGVRMKGPVPCFAVWDRITEWHGAETTLWDLIDRPEHMHSIMSKLTEANLAMLDQLEEKGLLGCGQVTVHCTGAYTDELPAPGFDPEHPRTMDLWTFGMAQIFSEVSPAMHKEFELDYAQKWFERFGLGYYGCCEPLHNKIDLIDQLPRVRKISMSPWVDVEKGAEAISGRYVFSRKPSPAFLADAWDPEAVERDLRETLDRCNEHGCPLELILKDISTVAYQPQRLWEWSNIAMKVVGGVREETRLRAANAT